jgi:hypothetical protein
MTDRDRELYDKHEQQAWQDIQTTTDRFDQSMLTLSSAALGVSVAFIKDIVPFAQAVWSLLLYASWICFSLCIVVTVLSFQVSRAALKQHLDYLKRCYLDGDRRFFNKQSLAAKMLPVMSWTAATFFVLGIVSTLVFCGVNVANARRSPSMKDTKRSYVTDGRAPVQMTPVEERKLVEGRAPVQMTPTAEERGRQPVAMTPADTPGDLQKGRQPVTMTPTTSTPPVEKPTTPAPAKKK